MAPVLNANTMMGQPGMAKIDGFSQFLNFLFKLKIIKKVFDF